MDNPASAMDLLENYCSVFFYKSDNDDENRISNQKRLLLLTKFIINFKLNLKFI